MARFFIISLVIIGMSTSAACIIYPPGTMPDWMGVPLFIMVAILSLWGWSIMGAFSQVRK